MGQEKSSTTISKTFPVKPKIKPTLNKSTPTPESNYWKSFKSPKQNDSSQTLISSITCLNFSPTQPHKFAATHSATVTIFSGDTLLRESTISGFKDTATCASFRSDGKLIAAGSLSGVCQVFDVKTRVALRKLRGHSRPVHVVKYPRVDKLHLFSGGDDAVVNYWDVASECVVGNFVGRHKDYVRAGEFSSVTDHVFVTGSYDHSVKVWDVRVGNGGSVVEFNHGKPVEDVVYLPSGGLIATAGGNCVKIWDVIGGGKLLHSMESHNKTVTSICVGKFQKDSGEEAQEYRILSVGLDGYMKVFDYAKLKVTHSMRYPAALMSVAFSPDCSTRVIGASNGVLYAGKRKVKKDVGVEMGKIEGVEVHRKRELRPAHVRYFSRGQTAKPSHGDYLVLATKRVKLAEHDKLLKKFRHKEALVSALSGKNPGNVVAVMEELVARRKLLKCVSNLETGELGLLLEFLQRHSTVPRYAGLLMGLSNKVVEMRAEEIRASDELKGHIRNLKRSVEEEIRCQQSMLEIQGIISPLLRMAGR